MAKQPQRNGYYQTLKNPYEKDNTIVQHLVKLLLDECEKKGVHADMAFSVLGNSLILLAMSFKMSEEELRNELGQILALFKGPPKS